MTTDTPSSAAPVARPAPNDIIANLLHDIAEVCKAEGWTHSRFGRNVMGDPAFVTDLRQGRNPTAKTLDRLYKWLDARSGAAA